MEGWGFQKLFEPTIHSTLSSWNVLLLHNPSVFYLDQLIKSLFSKKGKSYYWETSSKIWPHPDFFFQTPSLGELLFRLFLMRFKKTLAFKISIYNVQIVFLMIFIRKFRWKSHLIWISLSDFSFQVCNIGDDCGLPLIDMMKKNETLKSLDLSCTFSNTFWFWWFFLKFDSLYNSFFFFIEIARSRLSLPWPLLLRSERIAPFESSMFHVFFFPQLSNWFDLFIRFVYSIC